MSDSLTPVPVGWWGPRPFRLFRRRGWYSEIRVHVGDVEIKRKEYHRTHRDARQYVVMVLEGLARNN